MPLVLGLAVQLAVVAFQTLPAGTGAEPPPAGAAPAQPQPDKPPAPELEPPVAPSADPGDLGLFLPNPLVAKAIGLVHANRADAAIAMLIKAIKEYSAADRDGKFELQVALGMAYFRGNDLGSARKTLANLQTLNSGTTAKWQACALVSAMDKLRKADGPSTALDLYSPGGWRQGLLETRKLLNEDLNVTHDNMKRVAREEKWGSLPDYIKKSRSCAEQIEAIKFEEPGLANRDIMKEHAIDLAATIDGLLDRVHFHQNAAQQALVGLSKEQVYHNGKPSGWKWNHPEKLTEYQRHRSMLEQARPHVTALFDEYRDVQRRYPTRISMDPRYSRAPDPLSGVPNPPS